jgi:hypothetical protein
MLSFVLNIPFSLLSKEKKKNKIFLGIHTLYSGMMSRV